MDKSFCCCCNLIKKDLTIYRGYMICSNCYGNYLKEEIYGVDEIDLFINHVQCGDFKIKDVLSEQNEVEE